MAAVTKAKTRPSQGPSAEKERQGGGGRRLADSAKPFAHLPAQVRRLVPAPCVQIGTHQQEGETRDEIGAARRISLGVK